MSSAFAINVDSLDEGTGDGDSQAQGADQQSSQTNDQSVSGTDDGSARTQVYTVGTGQTLELSSGYSGTVSFTSDTGTLRLDNSASFTGTVAGLTGSDTIDFADINPATLQAPSFSGNASGGTLSVNDGVHTASIALIGNYLASSFVPAADGTGGTSVSDPPLESTPSALGGSTGVDPTAPTSLGPVKS